MTDPHTIAVPGRQFFSTETVPTDVPYPGTLAHDLRQPLSAIETIAYYLEMITPEHESSTLQHLARIRELVARSEAILSEATH